MRREQRMNPKCQTRPGFDTFSAKSADLTGLKMRRITRAVLFDRVAFGPRQPGPDCRISNWRGAVSGCRNNYPVGRRLVEPLLIVDQRGFQGIVRMAVIADINRDRNAAMNVTFVAPLPKSDVSLLSGDVTFPT